MSSIKQEEDSSNATMSDEESEEKLFLNQVLNYCKFCCGVIKKPRYHPKFCSKSCADTFRMFPLKVLSDGIQMAEVSFAKREKKDWGYYREILRERAPPLSIFSQLTEPVKNLEPGMKLEALDIMNPANYCVATVIKIAGHRLCIRYDGFGDDSSYDQWFNFQAEELFPIGWCSKNGYSLQPPTGIVSTPAEWKSFLSKTLTGALAAPIQLFRSNDKRRQLKCHSHMTGDKLEVIHPKRPDLIVSAVVSKSLGPYYFLITTENLPYVPTCTFHSYADAPGVFSTGWCLSRGLKLDMSNPRDMKMVQVHMNSYKSRYRFIPLKALQKLEVLDNDRVCVATVAELFGNVALLIFDNTKKKKFVDRNSTDIFPIGWCEKSKNTLWTPYGPVDFQITQEVELATQKLILNNFTGSFKQFVCTANEKPIEKPLVSPVVTKPLPQAVDSKVDISKYIEIAPAPPSQPATSTIIATLTSFPTTTTTTTSITTATTINNVDESSTATSCSTLEENTEDEEIEMDVPLSPKSPVSHEKAKNEMENFIVWLLNHYEFDPNEAVYVVKQDLVDSFTNTHNVKILPRWFALLYKLFPGAATVRRCHEGKFLNCLRNLKERTYLNSKLNIYVSDVAEYLKECKIQFLMDSFKMVILIPIGNNAVIPSDTSEIFAQSKAKSGSNIFTISADIDVSECFLKNFRFYYEDNTSIPPLEKMTNMADFRAAVKILTKSRLCKGVEVVPKPDNTIPNFRQGKVVKNGRLFSANCNTLAYVHKGTTCICCKSVRYYQRNTPSKEAEALLSPDGSETRDGEEGKEEEMLTDLQFFFNQSCFIGHMLDPTKVSKMWEQIPKDRPAQALKYLVERLIEVSNNKEKFLEMLEDAFGARLFNREKQKVVKKGLFRFNTRRKVLKFLCRLNKRLQCCDFFMRMERVNCNGSCKGRQVMKNSYPVNSPVQANQHTHIPPNPPPPVQPRLIAHKSPSNATTSKQPQPYNSGNMQLVYQLPAPKSVNSPQYVLQSPPPINMPARFPQGTQFLVPQTGVSNVATYMVVSKENVMSNIHVPLNGSPHIAQPSAISSLTTGVTQMISNVSKSGLLSDIDDPNLKKQPNSVTIVKSGMVPNSQPLIIKNEPGNVSSYITPANKSPIYRERNPQMHAPRVHYVSNEAISHQAHENMRPVVQAANKHQQKHVHKSHHGNARIKYVEFKPMQQEQNENIMHMKQPVYPMNKVHLTPTCTSDLIIHTPGVQTIMQPSPPALRPPPIIQSRSIALTSPPSLVASPELRPRYNFSPNAAAVGPHPYRVNPNQIPKNYDKNHVTFSFGMPQQQNVNKQMENYPPDEMLVQGSSLSNSSSTAMTMAYIPIQTQSKDKLLYVPVNSLQTNPNGQQILLCPTNQQLKDNTGKPILLSPQVMPKKKLIASSKNDIDNKKMTTFRIQDGHTQINKHIVPKKIKTEPDENVEGFSKISIDPPTHDTQKQHNQLVNDNTHEVVNKPIMLENTDAIPIKFEETGKKRKLESESLKNKSAVVKIKKKRGRPPSASKSPSLCNGPTKVTKEPEDPSKVAATLLANHYNKTWNVELFGRKLIDDPLSECSDLPANPEDWSVMDVERFLGVTDCNHYSSILRSEEIDGRSFMMLTREALMEFIGMRLGPALKISGYAALLRAKHRTLSAENKKDSNLPINEKKVDEAITTVPLETTKPSDVNEQIVNGFSPSNDAANTDETKAEASVEITESVPHNDSNSNTSKISYEDNGHIDVKPLSPLLPVVKSNGDKIVV